MEPSLLTYEALADSFGPSPKSQYDCLNSFIV